MLLTAVGQHEFAKRIDGGRFESELTHGFLVELVRFSGREAPLGGGGGVDRLRAEPGSEHAQGFVEMGFFVGHGGTSVMVLCVYMYTSSTSHVWSARAVVEFETW